MRLPGSRIVELTSAADPSDPRGGEGVAEIDLAALPLETITVTAAGRRWSILAALDQDRLLAAAGNLRVFPYGVLLWESALVLADVLAEEADCLTGRTLLELGAGTGLAGLAGAALGARVVQTDHSAEALALCRRNATANGIVGIERRFGNWTDWRDEARYDLVVGADVLYEPELFGDIAAVLAASVAPGGRVVLTDPGRTHTDRFIERLQGNGWEVTLAMRDCSALPPGAPGGSIPVRVIKAQQA